MKILSASELHRRTAQVLDELENGETFELRRRGKIVGYLTRSLKAEPRLRTWKQHFEWLKTQKGDGDSCMNDLLEERQRRRDWEDSLFQ